MSGSAGPFQQLHKSSPPLKGSFPLDHDSECRTEMFTYMRCVNEKRGMNEECRHLAKKYFACRMDRGLMERDEWSRLGLPEDDEEQKMPPTLEK